MFKKAITLALALLFVTPTLALAQTKSIQVLSPNEVINKDYFVAGDIVEVYGTVNGDVYAAGGTVLINGIINGDLIAAGGTVTIAGEVLSNVRVAGGQITITGNVGRNVTALGGNIDLTDDASVAGSLTVASGNVNVNSPVGKGIMAGAGNLTIANLVGGDIEAAVGNLRLTPNAQVSGSVNYMSEEEVSVASTASVSGTITKRPVPEFMQKENREAWKDAGRGLNSFFIISSFLASLVIGLLMIKFLPKYTENTSNLITTKFLPSLGIGFVGLIVVPVAMIALAMTIIGIPFALFLGLVFIAYLYVSRLYAMVAIGTTIAGWLKFKTSMYGVFLIGLIIYYLLGLIPVIGWLITTVVIVASFGAALKNERNTWAAARKAKII